MTAVPNSGAPIRVLLVDDHEIVRDGLRRLLESEEGITVEGVAGDGRDAVAAAEELSPDVVVMDVGMPEMNGVEATRQIVSEHADVRVLCLSIHSERRFVSAMLDAGATGYLTKKCAADELVKAVRTVTKGDVYLSTDIAGVVVQEYVQQPGEDGPSAFAVLTDREREVLQLIAEGHSTKEIADQLKVSVKTVGTHREHIMDKLGRRSVAELTKYALREGLSEL